MTEKTLTTENIKPALDALRGELAPWPVVAKKQDRLNTAQLNAANSGITSSLVAQIIANTAAIRALESAITGTGLRDLVVSSLPAIGTQGILYIVPVTTYDPETDADVVNYSNEYLWIPVEGGTASEGHYEQVGQTGIVINNGQLTITVNGTPVGTFTANQSGDTTAAITVPTNADYVDRTTDQTVAGKKTWTGEQSFTLPIVGSITGTATKAIADEDGTSIKTGYVNVAGNQTVTGDKSFTGSNTFNNILPNATNSYSLGSSSYQWSSVYAQTYYYNGTAWGLDKANVWGNTQTVTGNDKGWNIINPDIEKGVIPNANKSSYIWWADKNNNFLGRICSRVHTDGTTMLWLSSLNYYKNGALDPTGSSATTSLILGVDANAYKFVQTNADFRPDANNTSNLGTSTNQWKSVYSQTYYYNGTAWGLDKANAWTDHNRFSKSIAPASVTSVTDTTLAFNGLFSTIFLNTRGSSNRVSYGSFLVAGYGTASGADNYGQIQLLRSTDKRGDTNDGYVPDTSFKLLRVNPHSLLIDFMENVRVVNDGTYNTLCPITTDTTDLGTSTNKWKTLNGVNPGALSLPDYNSSAKVDISGSIIPDQYGNIYYTPPINGWLYVCFNVSSATTTDSIFYIQAKDNNVANSSFIQTSWALASVNPANLAIFFPVVANKRFIMQINFSNYSIIKAHVIPCLGNV